MTQPTLCKQTNASNVHKQVQQGSSKKHFRTTFDTWRMDRNDRNNRMANPPPPPHTNRSQLANPIETNRKAIHITSHRRMDRNDRNNRMANPLPPLPDIQTSHRRMDRNDRNNRKAKRPHPSYPSQLVLQTTNRNLYPSLVCDRRQPPRRTIAQSHVDPKGAGFARRST